MGQQTMRAGILSLLLALSPAWAYAQAAGAGDTERTGHQLFTQSCAVCHLKPQLISRRYGPELNHDTVAGRQEAIRAFIEAGTPRMPGFRYELSPAQIDAIIAYLATVPAAPQAPAAGANQHPGGMP